MSNKTNKTKLRIAVIGCGGIANQKHLPALSKLKDDVELAAFCDLIPERAAKAAKQYGIENASEYTDYKKLLQDKTIDVVHVCTPNVSHCAITVDALESGKHVMCEKPMAINSEEAKMMVDTAKRTGKKLTIGYQNRFREDTQFLYNVCRNNELGDIYFAKAHAIRRRAVPTWGVFCDKEKQGGGPLIDIGTHSLDLTLWFMNNYSVKTVLGSVFYKMKDKTGGNMFGPWVPEEYNVEDSAFGLIKMENGATIFLEASWVLNTLQIREAEATLCGTEGGAEIKKDDASGSKICVLNGEKHGKLIDIIPNLSGSIAYFNAERKTEADMEAESWIHAVLEDKEPLVKPEEAYIITKILEAIYTSASTGKVVEF